MDSSDVVSKIRRIVGNFGGDSFDEPNVQNGLGSFGDFELVGHGKATNADCGHFSSFYGCVLFAVCGFYFCSAVVIRSVGSSVFCFISASGCSK